MNRLKAIKDENGNVLNELIRVFSVWSWYKMTENDGQAITWHPEQINIDSFIENFYGIFSFNVIEGGNVRIESTAFGDDLFEAFRELNCFPKKQFTMPRLSRLSGAKLVSLMKFFYNRDDRPEISTVSCFGIGNFSQLELCDVIINRNSYLVRNHESGIFIIPMDIINDVVKEKAYEYLKKKAFEDSDNLTEFLRIKGFDAPEWIVNNLINQPRITFTDTDFNNVTISDNASYNYNTDPITNNITSNHTTIEYGNNTWSGANWTIIDNSYLGARPIISNPSYGENEQTHIGYREEKIEGTNAFRILDEDGVAKSGAMSEEIVSAALSILYNATPTAEFSISEYEDYAFLLYHDNIISFTEARNVERLKKYKNYLLNREIEFYHNEFRNTVEMDGHDIASRQMLLKETANGPVSGTGLIMTMSSDKAFSASVNFIMSICAFNRHAVLEVPLPDGTHARHFIYEGGMRWLSLNDASIIIESRDVHVMNEIKRDVESIIQTYRNYSNNEYIFIYSYAHAISRYHEHSNVDDVISDRLKTMVLEAMFPEISLDILSSHDAFQFYQSNRARIPMMMLLHSHMRLSNYHNLGESAMDFNGFKQLWVEHLPPELESGAPAAYRKIMNYYTQMVTNSTRSYRGAIPRQGVIIHSADMDATISQPYNSSNESEENVSNPLSKLSAHGLKSEIKDLSAITERVDTHMTLIKATAIRIKEIGGIKKMVDDYDREISTITKKYIEKIIRHRAP